MQEYTTTINTPRPPPGYRYRLLQVPLDELTAVHVDHSMVTGYGEEGMSIFLDSVHLQQSPEHLYPQTSMYSPEGATTTASTSAGGTTHLCTTEKEEQFLRDAIVVLGEESYSHVYMMFALVPVVLIAVLAVPVAYLLSRNADTDENVCYKESCLNDADRFKAIMRHAPTPPCRDFYSHVCSLWIRDNFLPDYAFKYSYDDQQDYNVEALLAKLLKGKQQDVRKGRDSQKPIYIMADIFDGCVDTSRADNEGIRRTMQGIVSRVFIRGTTVTQAMARVATRYGIEALFEFRLDRAATDEKVIFEFDRPDLMVNPKSYMTYDLKVRETDRRLLMDAAKEAFDFLRIPRSQSKASQVVDLINEIGKRVLSLASRPVTHEHGLYAFQSLEESDLIDWREFIYEAVGTSIYLYENTTVRIRNDWYFVHLTDFIEQTAVSSENLSNYIKFLLVLRFSAVIPRLRKVSEVRWRYSSHFKIEPPRWRSCLRFVDSIMPKALNWLYQQYHASLHKETSALRLYNILVKVIQELSDTIDVYLGNNVHLPAPARIVGHGKLASLRKVLFFTTYRTEKDIAKIYSRNRPVSERNVLEAAADMLQNDTALFNDLDAYKEGENVILFREHALGRKCVYHHAENALYVPQAMFQGAYFRDTSSDAVFLAKMSFEIARGLVKIYDQEGTVVDDENDYIDWLGTYGRERYTELDECIVKLYNVTDPKLKTGKVDARMTLDENLADLLALGPAFHYFRRKITRMVYPKPHFRLPDFPELSSNRIFFYSFGETFCEQLPPDASKHVLKFRALPPNRIRLNTILKNYDEFGKAFNCRIGSPMRPPRNDTCDVWPRPRDKLLEPINPYSRAASSLVVVT